MDLETVDNYRIIDELGHGGMAVVYRARDTRLERDVALKILHDHIANREENRARFIREAKAVAKLKHPNIIQIYGFSSPSARVGYIAAELIEGPTLRQLIEHHDGPPLPEVGAMIGLVLAEALAHAHELRRHSSGHQARERDDRPRRGPEADGLRTRATASMRPRSRRPVR